MFRFILVFTLVYLYSYYCVSACSLMFSDFQKPHTHVVFTFVFLSGLS